MLRPVLTRSPKWEYTFTRSLVRGSDIGFGFENGINLVNRGRLDQIDYCRSQGKLGEKPARFPPL